MNKFSRDRKDLNLSEEELQRREKKNLERLKKKVELYITEIDS